MWISEQIVTFALYVINRLVFAAKVESVYSAVRTESLYSKVRSVVKVKLKRFRYRPGVAQRVPEVKFPGFHDNGTGWW